MLTPEDELEIDRLCLEVVEAANTKNKSSAFSIDDIELMQSMDGWIAELRHMKGIEPVTRETYSEALMALREAIES